MYEDFCPSSYSGIVILFADGMRL